MSDTYRRIERLSGSPWAVVALLVVGLALPLVFPSYQTAIAVLWMMVVFALTWDVLGGQMGYNSFGNIVFFGVGMYVAAVVQRELYFDIGQFESISDKFNVHLTSAQYLTGFGLGTLLGMVICGVLALLLGYGILGLRGHYFAICTLGLGVAAGEIAGGIDYIGAGAGMAPPVFPEALGSRGLFFAYFFLALTVASFVLLRWLYGGRFGLAINAIRDDEDKADSMGIPATRYKSTAWCVSAVFLAAAGAGFGHLNGWIEPAEIAFPGATMGVWMVVMAVLGGKGTLWGPVIGAVVFYVSQQTFWVLLLGWQLVALGLLIVVIVVFFPEGIVGWLRARRPATDKGPSP